MANNNNKKMSLKDKIIGGLGIIFILKPMVKTKYNKKNK